MSIEQFIIDLLKHHNCVVVPNFGGFIANYQPAIIDSVSKTITPPSKQIMFNANLLKNDGLLANYVADKRAISYLESLTAIENKTQVWKTALKNEKRLVFGEIGFLYEQDGKIVFEQNRETNLWLKAYGLSSIQFIAAEEKHVEKPIAAESVNVVEESETKSPVITLSQSENIEAVETEKSEAKVIAIHSEKKSRKKWGYVAAACAIPFLFYTYWIPMETSFLETGNIQLSDFNPFRKSQAAPIYTKRNVEVESENQTESETFESMIADLSPDVKIYNYQFDESLYIPVKLEKQEPEVSEVLNEVALSSTEAKEAPIQLITGCFSVESNANNLVTELKSLGYTAYILDKNKGLYRVAVKGFNSMEAAKSAKSDLKSKSYSSWILRK